jgi:hypothetical protein
VVPVDFLNPEADQRSLDRTNHQLKTRILRDLLANRPCERPSAVWKHFARVREINARRMASRAMDSNMSVGWPAKLRDQICAEMNAIYALNVVVAQRAIELLVACGFESAPIPAASPLTAISQAMPLLATPASSR